MQITIRCFGPARDVAGAEILTMEVAEPATVADAMARLAARGDRFMMLLRQCAVAVDDEIVQRSHPLASGAEIALLPPVAGG